MRDSCVRNRRWPAGSLTAVPPSLLATGIGPQTIRTEIDGLSFQEIIDLANRQPIKISR